jgi:hypothetical protein
MWKLLQGYQGYQDNAWRGVIPPDVSVFEQNSLPQAYGIGFIDITTSPGSDGKSLLL